MFRLTSHDEAHLKELKVVKCSSCHSYYYVPLSVNHYDAIIDDKFVAHYVQESAGIQCMFEMLLRIPKSQAQRLLEIGSGYGFVLDLWRHWFGTPAWGIEPASYGQRGRNELGVNLQRTLLKEGMDPAGDGRKFSVVGSIEVIEHVEDVAGFIRMAASYLEEDGILLLSTPNPGMLDREASTDGELYQTLSPLGHTVIMSPQALEQQLNLAGFPYVQAYNSPQQQVVYASRKPLNLTHPTYEEVLDHYEGYLNGLMARISTTKDLHLGAATRLLECLVNRGKFAEAVDVQSQLEVHLRKQFSFYRFPPLEGAHRALKRWTRQGFLKAIPLRYATLQYYRGMTALMYKKDEDLAIEHFEAARILSERFLKIFPTGCSQVLSALDQMRFQVASLRSRRLGELRTQGLKELKRMRREGTSSHPTWREKASIERLKALMDYERHREALEEMEWLEDWWKSGPMALAGVLESPADVLNDLVEAKDSERAMGFLWYLNARGQLAQLSHEKPDLGLKFRNLEDAGLAYEALVAHSKALLKSPDQSLRGMLFFPSACYQLGHVYLQQNRESQARRCWMNLLATLELVETNEVGMWKRAAAQALKDTREESPPQESTPKEPQVPTDVSRDLLPVELETDLHDIKLFAYSNEKVHFQVEQSWSDDGNVFVRGFVLTHDAKPEEVSLTWKGRAPDELQWLDRPDVAVHFPHMPLQAKCGFLMLFRRRAVHEFELTLGDKTQFQLSCPATGYTLGGECTNEGFQLEGFINCVNQQCQSVLEIGSRLVSPGAVSNRAFFAPHVKYTGFDYHPDENTDVVGDAHRLRNYFPEGTKFDSIFSCVVLEHTHAPWQIVLEINHMLSLGGLTYHVVPFIFPMHEMPWDFWRFTPQALKSLFNEHTGFEILEVGMCEPCYVHPSQSSRMYMQTPMFESGMMSYVLAKKIAEVDTSRFRWDMGALEALPQNEGVYPLKLETVTQA